MSIKSEDVTLISENFMRPTEQYVHLDVNNEQSW